MHPLTVSDNPHNVQSIPQLRRAVWLLGQVDKVQSVKQEMFN